MTKIALAFSGGKDSLACLYKLRKSGMIDHVTALWVDTGKNFPEQLEMIEEARSMIVLETVKVDREAQNKKHGLPADVVPVDWTHVGQMVTGPKEVTIQSYLECCAANIGYALHRAAVDRGFTDLIRGQRIADRHKSPARDGVQVDTLTYRHPIEHWTDEQVLEFIEKERGSVPAHFYLKHTSMDCYDC